MGCGANLSTISPKKNDSKLFASKNFIVGNIKSNIKETYELGKIIGTGSFGEVFNGIHRALGAIRAVKKMKKDKIDKSLGRQGIINEFNLLRELDHPNVMKVYECYEDPTHMYLVTEYPSHLDC